MAVSAHASDDAQKLRDGLLCQGQPAPRTYEIQGAEVVDIDSGLIWQRCSVGQTWISGVGCAGNVDAFTFDNAQRLGHGPWRLPTNIELAKLIDHGRAYAEMVPTIDVDAFPDTDRTKLWYWTSTPDGSFVAWYVSFVDGRVSLDGRNFTYSVRLVRDGR
jgi:hypothetical protein